MNTLEQKLLAGIFLIQEKKILLLEKKLNTGSVWTIPFRQVYGFRHPSEHIEDLLQDLLSISVPSAYFLRELIVHKTNTDGAISFGYFPSSIRRDGKPHLRKHDHYKKYDRFSYDALPIDITPDLRAIISAHQQDLGYVEV